MSDLHIIIFFSLSNNKIGHYKIVRKLTHDVFAVRVQSQQKKKNEKYLNGHSVGKTTRITSSVQATRTHTNKSQIE